MTKQRSMVCIIAFICLAVVLTAFFKSTAQTSYVESCDIPGFLLPASAKELNRHELRNGYMALTYQTKWKMVISLPDAYRNELEGAGWAWRRGEADDLFNAMEVYSKDGMDVYISFSNEGVRGTRKFLAVYWPRNE